MHAVGINSAFRLAEISNFSTVVMLHGRNVPLLTQ
jgi:hypothetical protein